MFLVKNIIICFRQHASYDVVNLILFEYFLILCYDEYKWKKLFIC